MNPKKKRSVGSVPRLWSIAEVKLLAMLSALTTHAKLGKGVCRDGNHYLTCATIGST